MLWKHFHWVNLGAAILILPFVILGFIVGDSKVQTTFDIIIFSVNLILFISNVGNSTVTSESEDVVE